MSEKNYLFRIRYVKETTKFTKRKECQSLRYSVLKSIKKGKTQTKSSHIKIVSDCVISLKYKKLNKIKIDS